MKLTGNDIALAMEAISHAMNFYKKGGRSKFVRDKLSSLDALHSKLNEISDAAYPYEHSDDMPLDVGDEPIMKTDDRVIAKTRKRAKPEALRN